MKHLLKDFVNQVLKYLLMCNSDDYIFVSFSDTSEKDYIRVVGAMVDILKPLQQSGITGDFLIFTLQVHVLTSYITFTCYRL